jgi:hypothetical protein
MARTGCRWERCRSRSRRRGPRSARAASWSGAGQTGGAKSRGQCSGRRRSRARACAHGLARWRLRRRAQCGRNPNDRGAARGGAGRGRSPRDRRVRSRPRRCSAEVGPDRDIVAGEGGEESRAGVLGRGCASGIVEGPASVRVRGSRRESALAMGREQVEHRALIGELDRGLMSRGRRPGVDDRATRDLGSLEIELDHGAQALARIIRLMDREYEEHAAVRRPAARSRGPSRYSPLSNAGAPMSGRRPMRVASRARTRAPSRSGTRATQRAGAGSSVSSFAGSSGLGPYSRARAPATARCPMLASGSWAGARVRITRRRRCRSRGVSKLAENRATPRARTERSKTGPWALPRGRSSQPPGPRQPHSQPRSTSSQATPARLQAARTACVSQWAFDHARMMTRPTPPALMAVTSRRAEPWPPSRRQG